MAIINVALSDTFDTWRTKTNTLGTNQGDLANLDSGFAATDLVGALNELRSGEDLTQLDLPDSTGASVGRLKLGDDDDFQIYHNGTGSVINNATGSITIRTAGAGSILLQDVGGNDLAQFNDNADVKLYHNATEKLATTATGITVSGDIATSDNTSGQLMIANGTNFVSTPVSGDATIVANGTNFDSVAVSGDATLASNGALTIANDAVTNAMIATDAVNADSIAAGAVGASEIADGTITSTEFNNVVTLIIYDSSGSAVKTLRTPGS